MFALWAIVLMPLTFTEETTFIGTIVTLSSWES